MMPVSIPTRKMTHRPPVMHGTHPPSRQPTLLSTIAALASLTVRGPMPQMSLRLQTPVTLGQSRALAIHLPIPCPPPANDASTIPDGPLGDPVVVPTGMPDGQGISRNYKNLGAAAGTELVRGLIAFPIRDKTALEASIQAMYDPKSPQFRKYMSAAEFVQRHSLSQADIDLVVQWLKRAGLGVPRVAKNRLLCEINGTVEQLNRAFGISVHTYERSDLVRYFGAAAPKAPQAIAARIQALLVTEPPPKDITTPTDRGTDRNIPPPAGALVLTDEVKAYGLQPLYAAGHTGKGATIGVVAAGTFRHSDTQTFWKSQGIARPNAMVREVLEPPGSFNSETTQDIEWAGGLAPGANVIVYEGPDNRDTSLVFAWNEAIGAGDAQVVTTSFSRQERYQTVVTREAYHAAGVMAAATGVTAMGASGDGEQEDVPGTSPYVTAVGGTVLGTPETAWESSGCGTSATFPLPDWQKGVRSSGNRATVDLALNAGKDMVLYMDGWDRALGTSFSSPSFAAIVAVINSARIQAGKPVVGWINGILYTTPAVQKSFRDITSGGTSAYRAKVGWDMPTGWGAPHAANLEKALP